MFFPHTRQMMTVVLALAIGGYFHSSVIAQNQEAPQPADSQTGPTPQPKKTDSGGATGGSDSTKTSPKKKTNPRRIRVFLMDGSVIAGELSVDSINVQTEFGKLTVPVTKIISITPGLDSHTKLAATIKTLIQTLGDDDYKAREQAHKDLLAMGPPIRDIVAEYTEDKNAERKRHATEIVQKLDEMSEQSGFDEFGEESESNRKYVRYDLVETPEFTIAGKISPSAFQIESKYGPLKVSLNDIKRTEREYVGREVVSRRLTVPGQTLIQRGLKSSGIRVKAGDTIAVTATGRILMTPWGSSANTGPDGNSRYSYYSVGSTRFYGGTLVARIGDSGSFEKVGSRRKFVAKKNGLLSFGIAMNNSYAGSNYYFPGNYKLRIKVQPKTDGK